MRVVVTGAGGLIGHAVSVALLRRGDQVRAIDNDARGRWFGPGGSTRSRFESLGELGAELHPKNFRDALEAVSGSDAIVHCASQPSHDFSRTHPLEDSQVNYMGTVELLEAARKAGARFVFLSTNKVYGDFINSLCFERVGLRDQPDNALLVERGIDEFFPIDRSRHTPFGVSKLAADVMVQEYARTFGLSTVSFRCGCLTGPENSAVELQGFLGYLVRSAVTRKPYTVYGYEGYQVRDTISADDVASAIMAWLDEPKDALVYNLGGGPRSARSIREIFNLLAELGHPVEWQPGPARLGDHRWWVTDISRFRADYPNWSPKDDVEELIREMVRREQGR